jgi:hypothetical protein
MARTSRPPRLPSGTPWHLPSGCWSTAWCLPRRSQRRWRWRSAAGRALPTCRRSDSLSSHFRSARGDSSPRRNARRYPSAHCRRSGRPRIALRRTGRLQPEGQRRASHHQPLRAPRARQRRQMAARAAARVAVTVAAASGVGRARMRGAIPRMIRCRPARASWWSQST